MANIDAELARIRASRPELFEDEPALFERSMLWSLKIRRELLRSHTPARDRDPVFFWSYGPQGSGKSTTVSTYFKSIGVDPLELNIDDLTRQYAREVLDDENAISNTEDYFVVRNGWPNYVRKQLLRECAEKRMDIVWETTGRGSNLWSDFCAPLVKKYDYKVVVVYVLVPFVQLKQRLEARVLQTKQCHAAFEAVLNQCRDAARNTRTWFVDGPSTTEIGGFVYFNNACGFGEQQRIRSEVELQKFMTHYEFDAEVVSSICWRGISDEEILSNARGRCGYVAKRKSFGEMIQGPPVSFQSRKLNTLMGA